MAIGPDLAAVQNAAEFVHALRLLKVAAGDPSFGDMARASGVPRSTLADAVRSGRAQLPRRGVVRGFAKACGITDTAGWDEAWSRIQADRTQTPPPTVLPRELPPDVASFSGRTDALEFLNALVDADATTRIVTICGTAGVGKTALALHWSYQQMSRFPDGQLYINLRGYDPGAPIEPADAAGMLLRSLLPTGATIPADEHARISLYHSLTADRRLLIVLDNASSADQVRVLLAAGSGCVVVITSRDAMSGLVARDGARRLSLGVLSPEESADLLDAVVGDRARAEADAVIELARRCAYLPLGLRLAGELTASRPHVPIADHLAELDDASALEQLDAGGDGQSSLRAVFSWSYQRLADDAARAFRLLGVHPGRDYDSYAVAALTGGSLHEARALLRYLRRAHLLEESADGRYALHDLLRAYAIELADHDPERQAAMSRLLDYYVSTAAAAHKVLYPYDTRPLPQTAPGIAGPDLSDADQTLAWLDAERSNLVAAITASDFPRHVIALAAALDRYLNVSARHPDNITVHRTAMAAAQSIGDRAAEVSSRANLGRTFGQSGRYDEAVEYLTLACADAEALADDQTLRAALNNLGNVQRDLGNHALAIRLLNQAADLAHRLDAVSWEGTALGNLGICLEDIGQYQEALTLYTRARDLHRRAGHSAGEGEVLDSIGSVYVRLGRPADAIEQDALQIARAAHSPDLEVGSLNGLGRALRACGRYDEALAHHESALVLARQFGDQVEAALALDGLGDVELLPDHLEEANARWVEALGICSDLGIALAAEVQAKLTKLDGSRRQWAG